MYMSDKDRKILLTINLEGGLTQVSKIIKDKETGKKVRKNFKIPGEAKQRIILNEQFINYASSLESRPAPKANLNAYSNWKRMSEKDRLEFNVRELVIALSNKRNPMKNKDYYFKLID